MHRPIICTYNPLANTSDGSCLCNRLYRFKACNYNADAVSDDGTCTYAVGYYNCDGECNNPVDEKNIHILQDIVKSKCRRLFRLKF